MRRAGIGKVRAQSVPLLCVPRLRLRAIGMAVAP